MNDPTIESSQKMSGVACQRQVSVEKEKNACQGWRRCPRGEIEQAPLTGTGGAAENDAQQVITDHQHHDRVKEAEAERDHVAFEARSGASSGKARPP